MPKQVSTVYKTLSKNYLVLNGAGRKTAAVGLQSGFDDLHMFDCTDMAAIAARISSNATQRFIILSCSAELLFTNAELSNCRYTIYDIIARRDLNSTTNTDPGTAWANSYADEQASNSNWSLVGTTPFSSDLFTQFFKVLKMTHGVLGQGQTHCHRINFHPKRIVDLETISHTTNGLKGISCYVMVVFHGEPMNDVTTKTQVSTGACALDMVYRKSYKYTWMSDSSTNYSVTNALPSAFTVAANIVDIGSGTVVADSAA
jgi:hypothetical protein